MKNNLKLKISRNFSKAADNYDRQAGLQKQIAENIVLHSQNYLSPLSKILDIGSGTGFIAQFLDRKIYQADIALGMCKRSAQFSPAICADFESLPFADNSFDVVFSSSSLQWLEHPLEAFSETHRILKNQGYFCFTIFGGDTLKELRSSQGELKINSKVHKFYTLEEIKTSLTKLGFQVIFYEHEYKTLQHNSARDIFRYMKDIGANVSFSAEKPITREKLVKLENYYKNNYTNNNAGDNSLYSTWEVLYFICQK